MFYNNMRNCEMTNQLIENTIKYVKEVFATDFSGHDFFHTMRVYQMATNIASKENADLQMVNWQHFYMMWTTGSYRRKPARIKTGLWPL